MNVGNPNLRNPIQRGNGTPERPLVGELWARDSKGATPAMKETGNFDPDRPYVNFGRYYRSDFAALEFENVFMKSWLYVCREEDIPEVGDRTSVQVGPISFMIVRSDANVIKAFYNSCRHRGTKLCSAPSSSVSIRCPYHGWEWKLDGTLKAIPGHWDFKHVRASESRLREILVGTWGGFVFINADRDAAPLEEALVNIPEHFTEFEPSERYTAVRIRKLAPANWKIVQEAFMEGYHVAVTHPEGVPFNGPPQGQYDIWHYANGDVARQAVPGSVPSIDADATATSHAAAAALAEVLIAWHYPDAARPELVEEEDARSQIAAWHRSAWTGKYGRPNNSTDALMLDNVLYFMFPNQAFWLSETIPWTYQFLPHETDPEKSYFEVRLLLPVAEGEPRPPSAPVIDIGIDEKIVDKAPGMSFLGYVLDQDMSNMPLVQQGMKSADPACAHSQLSTYQESFIQHWNALIDERIAQSAARSGLNTKER